MLLVVPDFKVLYVCMYGWMFSNIRKRNQDTFVIEAMFHHANHLSAHKGHNPQADHWKICLFLVKLEIALLE